MGTSHTELSQTLFNMKTLLVCSVLVAASSAQLYAGFGYPYALGAPLTYTPHVVKPVIKEVEVPVEHITYGIKETGCTNVFGFAVPCLAEGEARRKRSADEEAEVEAAVAAPALTYSGLPLANNDIMDSISRPTKFVPNYLQHPPLNYQVDVPSVNRNIKQETPSIIANNQINEDTSVTRSSTFHRDTKILI